MKIDTRIKVIAFLAKFEKKYESGVCEESDEDLIEKALSYAKDIADLIDKPNINISVKAD
jgi:uncharacterized protein YktA (UPF0223 family)